LVTTTCRPVIRKVQSDSSGKRCGSLPSSLPRMTTGAVSVPAAAIV
jgi:hypothetical protein